MKKIIACFICIILLLTLTLPAFAAESESYFIVISENPQITDNYAAGRLKYYLEEITGFTVPVVTDSDEADGFKFIVGDTDSSSVDTSSLEDGGYIIRSGEDCLYINGAGNKGTISGVYAFLEDYCHCRWYEAGINVIPKNSDFSVSDDIDVKYEPYFEFTETDTISSRNPEFSLANGLNGGSYRYLTPEQGSTVNYLGPFAHSLVTYYCHPDKYFSSHPEYYAYRDGEYVPNQLCLTNPEVIDIVANEVKALLDAQHDPDADMQIVSLTQHDNQDYCECEKCKALDKANGSQSGSMITFVNKVAQKVKTQGSYDNIVFDTFAYQYTRKAPTQVVPCEDVIVRLCSIECCFGHTLDNPDCKENKDFMNDLSDWGKICDRIYIWDYVNNYYETVCIFPNFGVLQRNVQIFYENNVKGVYEEGNYYISESDGEFGEMRTYLLSKLMQDPYIDYYAEMDGYLEAVYGPGWANIREFIDIMTDHAVTKFSHLSIYQPSENTLCNMMPWDIKHCDELWQNAKNMAENHAQLNQIRHSELSWRYWKCANMRGEFSRLNLPYYWMNANDELYNDFIELGVIRMAERNNHYLSDCDLLHLLRHPFKWVTLYDEDIWDWLNPAVVEIFNFMDKIHNFF